MDSSLPQRPAAAGTTPGGIVIGRIVGTHGVRGELKLMTFNPDSEAIVPGMTLMLAGPVTPQPAIVRSVRPHKRVFLVTLEGCVSMDAAAALVGCEVSIDEVNLPPVGPDEIYHYQLLGMQVLTVDGNDLGRITEVLPTGASDVCTVRGNGREYLIPLIADVVRSIDREARTLVIDPLPGLLDL